MTTKKSVEFTALQTAGNGDLLSQGVLLVSAATVEAGTGDIDANDVIHMCAIPSDAIIRSIRIFNDDLDSHSTPALTVDCGLYHGFGTGTTNGTVVDIDCLATAITTLQAANTLGVNIVFEANDIVNVNVPAWSIGGLEANPGGHLSVALTVKDAAGTAAAGSISMIIEYIRSI